MNVERLLKIRSQDPLFWAQMQSIAKAMVTQEKHFYDDHSWSDKLSDDPIKYVLINQRLDVSTGEVRTSENMGKYNTSDHPIAWVCRFYGGVQCLNNLYLIEDRLHLTRTATGIDLNREEGQKLLRGELLRRGQKDKPCEQQFALPVEEFIQTMLN